MRKRNQKKLKHQNPLLLFKRYFLKDQLPQDTSALDNEFNYRVSQLTKELNFIECKELQKAYKTVIKPYIEKNANR